MAKHLNTHELSLGDIVESHGCKFKLTQKGRMQEPQDLVHDSQGVTWFKTECLEYDRYSMPKHWADTWIIQGNKNATWHVIED